MVSTAHQRILAAVAALGSALAMAVVVLLPSPAQAATCNPNYPASVATSTDVRLNHNVARYGTRTIATVRVRSDAGVPGGRVAVSVPGEFRAVVTLRGGTARVLLPRGLDARHTYRVIARYLGRGCFDSSSDSTSYTVTRAGTRIVRLDARNIRRGGHPLVTGRVVTTTGFVADGRVVVRISFRGDTRASKSDGLSGGRFSARFGRVFQTGRWRATVINPASQNYTGDRESTGFRVRGRR